MKREKVALGASALLLAVSLAAFFRSVEPKVFFNSDIITFPVLYRDLLIDGFNLSRWSISLHPDFVPDILLYFLINGIIGHPTASIVIIAILQLLGIAGAFLLFSRLIEGRVTTRAMTAVLTAASLITLLATFGVAKGQFLHVFQMNQHTGALAISLACAALLASILDEKNWDRRKARLVVLLAVPTLVSNKIVGSFLLVPWTLTVAVLRLTGRISTRQARRHIGLMLVSALIALPLMAAVRLAGLMTPAGRVAGLLDSESISNFFRDLSIFFQPEALPLSIYFALWLATVTVLLAKWLLNRQPARSPHLVTFVTFSLVFAVSVILMGALVGKHVDPHSFRRSIAAPIVAVFAGALLLALSPVGMARLRHWRLHHWRPVLLAAVFSVTLGLSAVSLARPDTNQLFGFYPEITRCIDELSARQSLRYGLAEYWDAKFNTFLSRRGLRIHSVVSTGEPHPHAANRAWYHQSLEDRSRPPEFTFILTRKLNENALRARFGDPDRIEECPQSRVFLYRPERAITFKDGA